jgi:hypothetical protein
MTPSEVRAALLGEHFELRRLVEEGRAILRSGQKPPRPDLRAAIDRLADSLLEHSRHEEAALREILGTVQGRKHPDAVMDEAHVAEHARLAGVVRAAVEDPASLAVDERVGNVLDALEDHMDHEEEVLLGVDLLGEDNGPNTLRPGP